MSRHRRGRDRHPYSDEFSRRPPISSYWSDSAAAPSSYRHQRSNGWEGYNEQWTDDRSSRYVEPSYSRRRRDFGPSRDRDDQELRRDRTPYHRNPPRQRYSTYTPFHNSRITARAQSPTNPAPLEPPREPSPPPKPLQPNPVYLFLSHQPSEVLCHPTTTRKLLVLDLNGTLLIRSPRSRSSSGKLRAVQPRPYMQSFRQYLFCMETKAWLDTMVWSSAQPHSVNDMVEKVFGASKDELKAVWNRTSLGLSEAEYHRKSVTTKDLSKPWELFASALVSGQSQSIHSAFTTLLLDDSPHKAALQPYNHVCIPEYDSSKRQHDLRSFLATRPPKQSKNAKRKDPVEGAAHFPSDTTAEIILQDILPKSAEEEPYDVILLAVIGILETAKLQSNVAAWIRMGGLCDTQDRKEESGTSTVAGGTDVRSTVMETANNADGAASTEVDMQTKMWFDDPSVIAFWAARGRRALMELGIEITHGVTG